MKILPEPVVFEWDKGNIDKNLKKHNVSNKEIEEAFKTTPIFIIKDEKHSTKDEVRYGMFSRSSSRKYLSIVFTSRKEKIRVITARDMSRKERRAYEKIKSNSKI